jgi:predicted AAA+ superfamily ATPase
MEIHAHRSYSELGYDVNFWRTKSGLEVDFILAGGEVALEVKGTSRIDDRDLYALRSFSEEFKPKHSLVVCNEKEERLVGKIRIVPWKPFLAKLWAREYL